MNAEGKTGYSKNIQVDDGTSDIICNRLQTLFATDFSHYLPFSREIDTGKIMAMQATPAHTHKGRSKLNIFIILKIKQFYNLKRGKRREEHISNMTKNKLRITTCNTKGTAKGEKKGETHITVHRICTPAHWKVGCKIQLQDSWPMPICNLLQVTLRLRLVGQKTFSTEK